MHRKTKYVNNKCKHRLSVTYQLINENCCSVIIEPCHDKTEFLHILCENKGAAQLLESPNILEYLTILLCLSGEQSCLLGFLLYKNDNDGPGVQVAKTYSQILKLRFSVLLHKRIWHKSRNISHGFNRGQL